MKRSWLLALALGGAAESLSTPQQEHNLLRLPSFRGLAEVRASLQGRMRLYMPAIAQHWQQAEQMRTQLESTGAVSEVVLNPHTSTVLIRYDERQVEGAVVLGAAMKLMGLDAAAQQEPVSRMESGLKALFASVNHGVLEATHGLLDARMLAGGVLTVAAVRSMKLYGAAVPGAMTLLWWAASIFRRGINGAD